MAECELLLLCHGLGGVCTSGEMALSWETEGLLSTCLVVDHDGTPLSLELVSVLSTLEGSACEY